METDIESLVLQREEQFIKSVQEILTKDYSDRIKKRLIYEEHLNCTVKINSLIAESITLK